MKTIIAGGRYYYFTEADINRLNSIKDTISEVISGTATGADTDGETWAKSHNIPIKRFRPDWNSFGRSAGYKRNVEMANYAEQCIIFPGGKGTDHMFNIATKKGLKVIDWRK